MSASVAQSGSGRQGVATTLVWTIGAGVALLALGGLAGRPDVLLLGAGPVLAGVWALQFLTPRQAWVDVQGDGGVEPGVMTQHVQVVAPPGTSALRLRLSRPEHGSFEALVQVSLRRELEVTAASVRTGPLRLARVEHQVIGGWGLHTGPVGTVEPDVLLVFPTARQMPALPLPVRLRGLTGQHESRRPGDGGGLRDVHPFQPGDTQRRVDWKVTARRSPNLEQLYVRRTMALGEASVNLVVDSRDDVGPDPLTWSGYWPIRPDDATSLDLARQAAATVAQGYLTVGDRVSVADLGVRRRTLRPGTGRRQLDRVLHQLSLLRPEGDPPPRVRPPQLAPGSLIYLFSTFLDPQAAELARGWRRIGHRVIAVDVMPRLRTGGLDARQWLALRVVRLEREDRLADLAAAGIELIGWADEGSATSALQQAARMSHRRPGTGARR